MLLTATFSPNHTTFSQQATMCPPVASLDAIPESLLCPPLPNRQHAT
jgi:hypothetical protein